MELTLKEVYEALFRGEIITIGLSGNEYIRLEEEMFQYSDDLRSWNKSDGPSIDDAPFTLYKPEPKSLTFEQAYSHVAQGGIVRIDAPFKTYTVDPGTIAENCIPLMYVAGQMNWLMTAQ